MDAALSGLGGVAVGIVLRFAYVSISVVHLALTFSPVAYLSESGARGVIDQVIATFGLIAIISERSNGNFSPGSFFRSLLPVSYA
jgi:hypothetical protein